MIDRRSFLGSAAACIAIPNAGHSASNLLRAAPGTQQIAPDRFDPTDLWVFDGAMPGRSLRARQGDRLSITVENALPDPTSVHWHGLRIDNAMDGVPGLTQEAIAPGDRFDYDFALPDAGTYWYHSHAQSVQQVERGLYGPLIVEEAEGAPDIDQDLTLMLDDIRLTETAQVSDDFGNFHDNSHAGRFGNVWLVNGQMEPKYAVQRGQRLRLRLISAANARVFQLGLSGMSGHLVALDGMPLSEPALIQDTFSLAPAQRADLIVDVTTDEAEAFLISFERDGGYAMASFPVSGAKQALRPPPAALPANPDFPIDLKSARTATLLMEGGAMGGMRSARLNGTQLDIRDLAQRGKFWAFNGTVGDMKAYGRDTPLIDVAQGESVRIGLANDTAFAHAMHLHGMHFSEVLADGSLGPLRDTLLMQRGETREIAFNAHNPGDWLFHCHILGHHASGMGTWLRVT
ncbi:multicopper oxidase family protein [Thalassococcus lentus]